MGQPLDTICALSSAPGRAGVAVIRVSGPGVRAVVRGLLGGDEDRVPEPRRASLRTLRDPVTGQDIDRAILLLYAGPSSFTGEDVVEILLHGGRAVIASILAALRGLGCRIAEPGEFARRAFENGKIDLTEAEGIADLIDAETEAQRRQAIAQAGGQLHQLYDGWRSELLDAMALTEAGIDFSDEEDVASDAVARARTIVDALLLRIAAHLNDGRRGEILRDGFRVVLAGAPNVGKSSLLNALAQREAAIVSPEAGTTRDVIEVRLDLGGMPVIVSDTAGIRDGGGDVEREGMRRAIAQTRRADLVLWVSDASAQVIHVPPDVHDSGASIVLVVNKVDLLASPLSSMGRGWGGVAAGSELSPPTPNPSPQGGQGVRENGDVSGSEVVCRVSAATGAGIGELVTQIAKLAADRAAPDDGPVITQARHREALEDCLRLLQDYLAQDLHRVELAAEDLRGAAQALGRITGKVDAEQVLGRIFSRFCIGK